MNHSAQSHHLSLRSAPVALLLTLTTAITTLLTWMTVRTGHIRRLWPQLQLGNLVADAENHRRPTGEVEDRPIKEATSFDGSVVPLEVEDQSQDPDSAVVPVIHVFHFALQMVHPSHMGHNPYPKHCIVLV